MNVTETTLQISLCPGDLSYAHSTIPRIISRHQGNVDEVLLVVDCCKPQATRYLDPQIKFPEPKFAEDVAAIREVACEFRRQGLVDRIRWVKPEDPENRAILRSYAGALVRETHDASGTAILAYFAAFDAVRTKYMVHYDADMLIYQDDKFDWVAEGRRVLESDPGIVFATPRCSPPLIDGRALSTLPADVPVVHCDGYDKVGWFSTRAFLAEVKRVRRSCPLIRRRYAVEVLLSRLTGWRFPPSPEIMFYRRFLETARWRADLTTERAWLLHPARKDDSFLRALPKLLNDVAAGRVPEAQRGVENLVLSYWLDP